MASSNSVGAFSLNNVVLRKPLLYPDGSVQLTAYEGAGGVPTLAEVLVSGSSAGSSDIDLSGNDLVSVKSVVFADSSVQSTAVRIVSSSVIPDDVILASGVASPVITFSGLDASGIYQVSGSIVVDNKTDVKTLFNVSVLGGLYADDAIYNAQAEIDDVINIAVNYTFDGVASEAIQIAAEWATGTGEVRMTFRSFRLYRLA
jgi:hypothetical protein